jgi:hypothetical protein
MGHVVFVAATTVELFDVQGKPAGSGCATESAERFA